LREPYRNSTLPPTVLLAQQQELNAAVSIDKGIPQEACSGPPSGDVRTALSGACPFLARNHSFTGVILMGLTRCDQIAIKEMYGLTM